jgi:hypothetical protein
VRGARRRELRHQHDDAQHEQFPHRLSCRPLAIEDEAGPLPKAWAEVHVEAFAREPGFRQCHQPLTDSRG